MLCSLCFELLAAGHLIVYHESEHVDCQAPLPSLRGRAYHRGAANNILADLAVGTQTSNHSARVWQLCLVCGHCGEELQSLLPLTAFPARADG